MKSVLLLVVLAASCERPTPSVVISDPVVVPPPDPLPAQVEPEPEPDLELESEPDCSSACLNLRKQGCSVAANTPEGSKCEEICENSFHIPALAWDVAALTRTETCPR